MLLLLILLFSLVSDSFFTLRNLTNIVTQNTYFIIVAIGMSFVLISGGIDLSVGYQMSLVGVLTAMMMVLWNSRCGPRSFWGWRWAHSWASSTA